MSENFKNPGRWLVDAVDDDEVAACPECDATSVRNRNPNGPVLNDSTADAFTCGECQATFDEPRIRERHAPTPAGAGSSFTARLAATDPSDIGGGADD
jgi:hypothetical protein